MVFDDIPSVTNIVNDIDDAINILVKTHIFVEAYVSFVYHRGRSPLRPLFYWGDSFSLFDLGMDELLRVLSTIYLIQSLPGFYRLFIPCCAQVREILSHPDLECHPMAVRTVYGRCRTLIGRSWIFRSVIFRLFYHGHNPSADNEASQMSLKLWQFHRSFVLLQGLANDGLRRGSLWTAFSLRISRLHVGSFFAAVSIFFFWKLFFFVKKFFKKRLYSRIFWKFKKISCWKFLEIKSSLRFILLDT